MLGRAASKAASYCVGMLKCTLASFGAATFSQESRKIGLAEPFPEPVDVKEATAMLACFCLRLSSSSSCARLDNSTSRLSMVAETDLIADGLCSFVCKTDLPPLRRHCLRPPKMR